MMKVPCLGILECRLVDFVNLPRVYEKAYSRMKVYIRVLYIWVSNEMIQPASGNRVIYFTQM